MSDLHEWFNGFRKFRKTCAKCRLRLENDDVVMRARDAVFHVHCFSCVVTMSYLSLDEQRLAIDRKDDSDEQEGVQ
ncbi:LIM domain protein [Cooperia oncophora]